MNLRRIILLLGVLAVLSARSPAVVLAWNVSTDPAAVGYMLHRGTAPGVYTVHTDVGNVATSTVNNGILVPGMTYYFAVTAYNTAAVQSNYTNEIPFTAPADTDASLASLVPSAGSLLPVFAPGTLIYADTVPNAPATIQWTATAAGFGATIKINGTTVSSGTVSNSFPLGPISTGFTIAVTAQDGVTTRSYVATIYRRPGGPNTLRIQSATP